MIPINVYLLQWTSRTYYFLFEVGDGKKMWSMFVLIYVPFLGFYELFQTLSNQHLFIAALRVQFSTQFRVNNT